MFAATAWCYRAQPCEDMSAADFSVGVCSLHIQALDLTGAAEHSSIAFQLWLVLQSMWRLLYQSMLCQCRCSAYDAS